MDCIGVDILRGGPASHPHLLSMSLPLSHWSIYQPIKWLARLIMFGSIFQEEDRWFLLCSYNQSISQTALIICWQFLRLCLHSGPFFNSNSSLLFNSSKLYSTYFIIIFEIQFVNLLYNLHAFVSTLFKSLLDLLNSLLPCIVFWFDHVQGGGNTWLILSVGPNSP